MEKKEDRQKENKECIERMKVKMKRREDKIRRKLKRG